MENNLKHYGILGMKWGVRRTKAQLRRARGPDKAPRKVTKEQYEAEKKKAIRSGDPATVERWKGHLTKQELKDAVDYVDSVRKLRGTDKSSVESGFEKVENVMNYVGRSVTIVDTLGKAYGWVAKINNTFNDKKLPTIDGTNIREKAAKDAADKAKKDRSARDFDTMKYLIDNGRVDEIIDNLDKYDSDAVKAATDYLTKVRVMGKKTP